MHMAQLVPGVVRPQAKKVGLVITNGNSQGWWYEAEAGDARASGINMFGIEIGDFDWHDELLGFAGDENRVIKVSNYDSLANIKESLAHEICDQ